MASNNKLGARERMEIEKIFMDDFKNIQSSIGKQLRAFYERVRVEVLDELKVNEITAEAAKLEEEIRQKQLELTRIRERLTREIYLAEQRLNIIKTEALGDLEGPPDAEQLEELGFNYDDPVRDRMWYGFSVRTKLEATILIRLKEMDIAKPLKAMEKIGQAVQREMAFVSTFDDAEKAYKKFYDLNFRQYGVDIPPRLDDLKKLKGPTLLALGIAEKKPTKMLPGVATAEE